MRALACTLALLVGLGVAHAKGSAPAKSMAKPAAKGKPQLVKKGGKGKSQGKKVVGFQRPTFPPGWSWPPSKESKEIGAACLARLSELGVQWKRGTHTRKIVTPVIVPDMMFAGLHLKTLFKSGPWVMDCHFAEAMARHAAPALQSVGVTAIVFSSIHKYRTVDGTRRLSRHALGLAVDVYGFQTQDGVKHEVEGGYQDNNVVLLDIERALNATGGFRMVLTPGNDPGPHHDHFHLEALAPNDKINTPAGPLYPRKPPPTLWL